MRKPAIEPRHLDFTELYWGRSFHVEVTNLRKRKLEGWLHATPGPRVGDTCEWRTADGTARGTFTKVEGMRDPMDMYHVEIKADRPAL